MIKAASLSESVKDLRKLYPELSDAQYARWYARKYNRPAVKILRILQKESVK